MSGRTIMRLDAIFESTLGALLIVAWPAGWFELGGWEGWPAALMGVGLVAAGAWIWTLNASGSMLRLLAIANGAGAVLFAGWLSFWYDGFDAAGAALIAATVVILALLAVAEWAAARSESPRAA